MVFLPCAFFSVATIVLAPDFFDALAALGGDFRRRVHGGKRVEGGAHNIVGVSRAEAFGEHVLHAHYLEHGAHRAAGDDASAFRRWLDQHFRCAVLADHRVLQGAALQADLDHPPARFLHRLLYGHRHLTRLALAHADAAVAIAYHGECGKTENTAALHHFGHAVYRYHLFAQ